MAEQEVVDTATKLVSEAKYALDEKNREQLKMASYLGELSDMEILKDSLVKLEKGLSVLKDFRPVEYEQYKALIPQLEAELERYEPKPKVEEKPVVVKPKRRKKGGS